MRKLNKKERLANTVEGYASCMCSCSCYCKCSCIVIQFNKSNHTDSASDSGRDSTWEATGSSNLNS